jgi:hypothetical protein
MPPPRSRPTRVEVDFPATLVASDGCEAEVTVLDLSTDGFRIRFVETVLPGEQVSLRAGKHGDLAAEIRWVRGSEAGGVFLERPHL